MANDFIRVLPLVITSDEDDDDDTWQSHQPQMMIIRVSIDGFGT